MILDALGLEPVLYAGMHLGEGAGAAAFLPLLDQALNVYYGLPVFAAGKVEAFGELNGMVQRINRLSAEVMREEGVPVLDAYSFLAERLDLAAGDAYHWSGEGYALLSEFIAKGLGLKE